MAMIPSNCGLQRNRLKESACQYTLNKVVDLYLANVNDVTKIDTKAVTSGCGEEVSAITLASDAKWFELQPSNDSASFSDALQVADRDVRYRTHTVTFSIGGSYDGESVCDLNGLSLGEFVVVAVLASGNAILLGTENVGLKATTAELVGAATATDFSGMNIEMSADVTQSAIPVPSAVLDTIKDSAKG